MNLLLAFVEDRRLGLGALGALAVVAGSSMAWLHVPFPLRGSATGYGLQDEGKLTVLLGALAIALLIAFARVRGRDLALGAVLCGLGAAALAAWYTTQIPEKAARVIARMLATRDAPLDPEVVVPLPARLGAGVWVVIAGSALLAVCAFSLTLRGTGTTAPAPRSRS